MRMCASHAHTGGGMTAWREPAARRLADARDRQQCSRERPHCRAPGCSTGNPRRQACRTCGQQRATAHISWHVLKPTVTHIYFKPSASGDAAEKRRAELGSGWESVPIVVLACTWAHNAATRHHHGQSPRMARLVVMGLDAGQAKGSRAITWKRPVRTWCRLPKMAPAAWVGLEWPSDAQLGARALPTASATQPLQRPLQDESDAEPGQSAQGGRARHVLA